MTRSGTRRRDEAGAVAIIVALLMASVMLGLAAIGVDTARWYVERERVQKAADAAALAGVVYLPDNLAQAVTTARASARINGYDHADPDVDVLVSYGERRSQLRVTVVSKIDNTFGAAVGVDRATVSRVAVADYTSPAPMGSPCNTFGNEPKGGSTTSGPVASVIPTAYGANCSTKPQFWGAIEGPRTDKQNGDRYSTWRCTGTFGCSGTGSTRGLNSEFVYPEGYFFSVKVGPKAVGTSIGLQVFDPAYYAAGPTCATAPSGSIPRANLNPYTTDATARYATGTHEFCTGDNNPGLAPSGSEVIEDASPVTTSFALREANDAQNPMAGKAISGCTAQFRGIDGLPSTSNLNYGSTDYSKPTTNTGYNPDAAMTFRQWYPLCSFTPTRSGDYYLQVRTNVTLAGTTGANNGRPAIVYRNNPAVLAPTGNTNSGRGSNGFALRAVSTAHAADISVSGWSRMPMFQNSPDSTATFNLLRVLPAAAGQSIAFEFFDVADGGDATGTVLVKPPADATGSAKTGLTKCSGALNTADLAPLGAKCQVPISHAKHNGQVQRMSIPIPSDYKCDDTKLTGCWFGIEITQNGAIRDFTTWDASLEGDPVRLIE